MKFFSKSEIFTIIGLGILCLLPTFIATIFTFPSADDFGFAELAMNHSSIEEFKRLYTKWSGRYTSITLGFLSPLAFGKPELYSTIIYLNLFIFVLSNILFFRNLLYNFKSRSLPVIASLFFCAIFFNLIPSTGETIYWYSGTITYLTPLIFIQFSIGYLSIYYHQHKKYALIIGSIFLLIGLGCNEVQSFVILVFSALCLRIMALTKHSLYSTLSILFIVVLLGAGALFIAPGNYARLDHFDNQNNVLTNILLSDFQLFRFAFGWLSSIEVWILLICTFVLGHIIRVKGLSIQLLNQISPMILFISPLIIIYSGILPAYLSMGVLGQHRTLTPTLYFFLFWLILMGIRMGYNSQLIGILYPYFSRYSKLIVLLLAGSILLTRNNLTILDDLKNDRFTSFFNEQIKRKNIIEKALKSNPKNAHLPPIQVTPESYEYMDIKNEDHWINYNYKVYYGLDNVIYKEK